MNAQGVNDEAVLLTCVFDGNRACSHPAYPGQSLSSWTDNKTGQCFNQYFSALPQKAFSSAIPGVMFFLVTS